MRALYYVCMSMCMHPSVVMSYKTTAMEIVIVRIK